MNGSKNATKSCASQLLQLEPLKMWTVDELGQYAEAQHEETEQREKDLAPVYWNLSKALNLTRKSFSHGQWVIFLEKRGIDKGRFTAPSQIRRKSKTCLSRKRTDSGENNLARLPRLYQGGVQLTS